MGRVWDKAVIGAETWKEVLRVLKPGSFAAIMSSPRQDVLARMIINLQDAGFRTDFTSIYYTYASGFPKAANISKLVDKREGLETIIGTKDNRPHRFKGWKENDGTERKNFTSNVISPTSDSAKTLDGSYAGFQPKPSVEVILMVMKPLTEKTFVDQALANGKGITWLDSVRIPFADDKDIDSASVRHVDKPKFDGSHYNNGKPSPELLSTQEINNKGRFPANLLVEDDVLNDGKITKSHPDNRTSAMTQNNVYGTGYFRKPYFHNDSGSYSRYFDLDKWFDTTFPFIITPKPSPREKGEFNKHATVKPIKLMSYLISLLSREGDIILDPFCGSGTTLLAAKMLNRKYIGIELNPEYVEIANKRLMSVLP